MTQGVSGGVARFAGVASLALALLASMVTGVAAQEQSPSTALEAVRPNLLPAQTPTAGNGIFRVRVDAAADLGAFSITTGPDHPEGGGLPVLSRSRRPGSSYTTVHSYDSGVNYTQADTGVGVPLAPHGVTTPLGTTGFRTTYRVTGADELRIVQDVEVRGTTIDDTFVVVTTRVTNTGSGPARVGIRTLWDLQLLTKGAPLASRRTGAARTTLATEQALPAPLDDIWHVEDLDLPIAVAGSLGSGAGGAFPGAPASSVPDLAQFASWPAASAAAFHYRVPDPPTQPGSDSALLTYWGDRRAHALTVDPRATVSVASYVHHFDGRFAPPGPPRGPPFPIRRHHSLSAIATAGAGAEPVVSVAGTDAGHDTGYGGGDLVAWTAEALADGQQRAFYRLTAHTREGFAFDTHPWRFGRSTIQWYLEPEGGGARYVARILARSDGAYGIVYRNGTYACDAAASYDAVATYVIEVPASCLGDPPAVRAWVGMAFERYPFIENPPLSVDYSPESGWSPWVGLTAP